MAAPDFSRLVTLACHDLRTPLATVNGFAKTLLRGEELGERDTRFVGLIDAAGEQMNELLDLLGLAARIESGRYEPTLREVDTLELVRSADERIGAAGSAERIQTDAEAIGRALDSLAVAALRHGGLERVEWAVDGRELRLSPVTEAAAKVVTGEEPKDLGSLVARIAIERSGGALVLDGETLLVRL